MRVRSPQTKALSDRRGNLGARMQNKYMCTPQNGGSSMCDSLMVIEGLRTPPGAGLVHIIII